MAVWLLGAASEYTAQLVSAAPLSRAISTGLICLRSEPPLAAHKIA